MRTRTQQMMAVIALAAFLSLTNSVNAIGPECKVPADCDDANTCTDDTCKGAMCVHTPVPDMAPCDDGNTCTYDDYCDYGVCYGYAQWCTDHDDCTIDYCDPATGCVNQTKDCDDSNPCTVDDCDSQSGCFYTQMQCPTGESCNPNAGECEVPCLGDLNWDGVVNATDLAQLLGAWGPIPDHAADLNGDGVINAADLALLLGAWGPCPAIVCLDPKTNPTDLNCGAGAFCELPDGTWIAMDVFTCGCLEGATEEQCCDAIREFFAAECEGWGGILLYFDCGCDDE